MPVRRTIPICFFCKYFDHQCWAKYLANRRCQAFPDGIPIEIVREQYDHREPHPQDNGIQFVFEEDIDELRAEGRFLPAYTSIEQVKASLELTFEILDTQRVTGYTRPPLKPQASDDDSPDKTDE